jgi:hypothetical protein
VTSEEMLENVDEFFGDLSGYLSRPVPAQPTARGPRMVRAPDYNWAKEC